MYVCMCIYVLSSDIYIHTYVMMKPPIKAADSAINVLRAPWFDMCNVWFFEVMK